MRNNASVTAALQVVEQKEPKLFGDFGLFPVDRQIVTCVCGDCYSGEIVVTSQLQDGYEVELHDIPSVLCEKHNISEHECARIVEIDTGLAFQLYDNCSDLTDIYISYEEMYECDDSHRLRIFLWCK